MGGGWKPGDLDDAEQDLLGVKLPTVEEAEEAEEAAKQRLELRRAYVARQMESPIFREWMMAWLTHWGTFATTFANGPVGFPDPMATMFKLGERSAGWDLWTELDQISPMLANQMRREALVPPEDVAGARRIVPGLPKPDAPREPTFIPDERPDLEEPL